MDQKKPALRGFAAMSLEKRREIASRGGKAIPPEKRSFSRDRDLAAAAGRKGGGSVDPARRSFSQDRDLAKTVGTKGGLAPHTREAKPE